MACHIRSVSVFARSRGLSDEDLPRALASLLHSLGYMPRNTDGNPGSYEEIVRKTVVDPDSSVRPTLEQEKAAREGYWALDADEKALQDHVARAVASTGITDVKVEVTRDLVTLRGRVADPSLLRTLEDAVASVPGVTTIHDMVMVGPT